MDESLVCELIDAILGFVRSVQWLDSFEGAGQDEKDEIKVAVDELAIAHKLLESFVFARPEVVFAAFVLAGHSESEANEYLALLDKTFCLLSCTGGSDDQLETFEQLASLLIVSPEYSLGPPETNEAKTKKRGRPPKYDMEKWEALYDEKQKSGLSEPKFAAAKGLDPVDVEKAFSALRTAKNKRSN